MTEAKASARRIELLKRQQLALELRKAGSTYRQIADAIRAEYKLERYGCGLAYRDVMMSLRDLSAGKRQTSLDVLNLELARLDEMTAAVYHEAIGGKLKSVDAMLRIMDRRATLLKLLLPAPVLPVHLSGPGGGPIPITEIEVRKPAKDELPTEDEEDAGDGDGDGGAGPSALEA